jgi:hypothetical protein
MTDRRRFRIFIALAGCFSVGLLAAAIATSGGTARASQLDSTTSKTCPDGFVLAHLSWGDKCLHEGEFCKTGNPEYHAYGFDCPDGRLVPYPTNGSTTSTPTTTSPGASTPTTTTSSSKATRSIIVLRPIGKKKPIPRTAQKAIARVRAAPDTNSEASPFQQELAWAAQWRRDKWWVVGLFESPWGTRFVVDATLSGGKVYTYIDYSNRPAATWVRATAKRFWHLQTLYTRLTPEAAISIAQRDTIDTGTYTVLDAAAKLARDTARQAAWYFAFYVQTQTGQRLVLVVSAGGGEPVEEGVYVDGYGFGATPELQQTVPAVSR